jgi:hypothetical protein
MQHIKDFANSLYEFIKHFRKTILLIVVVVILTIDLSTIISVWLSTHSNFYFPSVGHIRTSGVQVYWDSELTNVTTEIQWGTIYAGSSNDFSFYMRSSSNYETTLAMQTGNWTLLNSSGIVVSGPDSTTPFMNLTWNYDNSPISPNETIQVRVTLHVDNSSTFIEYLIQNEIRSFSFDISIRAQ